MTVEPQNESELVQHARGGDESAWEDLIRRHQESVFRLAYLLLGDPDDAQDVAQETFIRTHRHLDRFDESRALRPWLLRIASNLARNRKRSVGRYWHTLQRLGRAEEGPGLDPDDAQILWQAIRKLRHRDQQIIYMRYFLDLSEAEAAAALEIAPGTVKSRLHRALTRLRSTIERDFPELQEGLSA
jgi:RNA polymerase sigma-70 factor (ECF subfamily)